MNEFKPTHRNIKGDLYQKLGVIKIYTSGMWFKYIKYINSDGFEFAMHQIDFNARFEEFPDFEYPWDIAPDWAMFAATDLDGVRAWFPSYPVKKDDLYAGSDDDEFGVEIIDYVSECENWEHSVQERPR